METFLCSVLQYIIFTEKKMQVGLYIFLWAICVQFLITVSTDVPLL